MTPSPDSREARAVSLFADIVAERLPDTADHIRAQRGDTAMLADIVRAILQFATAEQQRIVPGEGAVRQIKDALRGTDGDEYTDAGMEDAFFRWPLIERALLAVLSPDTAQTKGDAS